MLYRLQGRQLQNRGEPSARPAESEFISLRDVRAFLARHLLVILSSIVIALLAGAALVVTAEPRYTARAQLVIDPESTRAFRAQAGTADMSLDNAQVESQIEFLRSERIALSVISALKLTSDPEFQGKVKSLMPQLEGAETAESLQAAEFQQLRMAIANFLQMLSVRRVGQSYVIEVAFTSTDPVKAARIANATVNAYIADQLEAKAQAARRGGQWLEGRIADLRKQLNTAARAAQEFRVQNNIVDAGSRGLLDDQQLAELNSQLVLARAKTVESQARLERIEVILGSGFPDAAVAEVLGSQLISGMRERYLAAAARLNELTSRYPADHPAVRSLVVEMTEQKRAMTDELRRIAEVYKSDAEVARTREEQLTQELNKRVRHAANTKEAQITAAELDTVAQTYRRMYESYLQTLAEAVQRESFPVSDARVISAAAKPLSPSWPRSKLMLALSGLAGAILGIGIAALRHSLDRTVRTPRQLRWELEIDCLGLVPFAKERSLKGLVSPRRLLAALPGQRWKAGRHNRQLDLAVQPVSMFANSMRGLKTSIDLVAHDQALKCLAITSLYPGEGKSTIASNLATLFAASGTRTLLIDGSPHESTGARNPATDVSEGLFDILFGAATLDKVKISSASLPLDRLAGGGRQSVPISSGLMGSDAMRQFLEQARNEYEMIIVDLPSMKTAADARAISPFVDAMVVVARSGGTPVEILGEALQELHSARAMILGVVLNKVNVRILRKHGNLAAAHFV